MNPHLRSIGEELRRRLEPIVRQPLNWLLIDRLAALQEREQAQNDDHQDGAGQQPQDDKPPR